MNASLFGKTVLVVEDDPDCRAFMEQILADDGARVVAVGTVAEAIAAFQREKPNVIVSDISMPRCDGYDFIHTVRAFAPDRGGTTPAVAVTALDSPEDRKRALLSGFQRHIAKPVDSSELLVGVASLAVLAPARSEGPVASAHAH